VIGGPLRNTKVGDPLVVKLETKNLNPNDLEVKIQTSNQSPKPKITRSFDNPNIFELSVTPDIDEPMIIHINLKGSPIEGAPIRCDVDKKTMWGSGLTGLLDALGSENQYFTLVPISDLSEVAVNQPCLFAAVPDPGSNVSAQSVSFKAFVTGDDGSSCPALVRDTGSANFEVRFVPLKRINYTLDVQLYDKSIKGSPYSVQIRAIGQRQMDSSERDMKISCSIDRTSAVAKQPFKYQIVYANVDNPHSVTSQVLDPSGTVVPTQMTVRAHDKENDILVVPPTHGSYRVKVFYDGTPVSGPPMGFEVSPEPTSKVVGPNLRQDGVMGVEYVIKVAAINCTLNNYKIAVKGPSGSVVASFNLDPNGNDVGITTKFNPQVGSVNPNGIANGLYDFKFTPKLVGDHQMIIFFNGGPLPGSPVTIQVAPSPHQSVTYGTSQVVNKASASSGATPRDMGGYSSPLSSPHTSPPTGSRGPQVIGGVGGGPMSVGAGGGPQVIGAVGGGPQVIGAYGGGPQVIGAAGGGPQVIGAVGGGPQVVSPGRSGSGPRSDRSGGSSSKKSGGKSSSSTKKKK